MESGLRGRPVVSKEPNVNIVFLILFHYAKVKCVNQTTITTHQPVTFPFRINPFACLWFVVLHFNSKLIISGK